MMQKNAQIMWRKCNQIRIQQIKHKKDAFSCKTNRTKCKDNAQIMPIMHKGCIPDANVMHIQTRDNV
jgi:hypothetical protein